MHRKIDSVDLDFRDASIPGGTLIAALWNRDLMRLSDRGRASELIGDRWAEICATALSSWVGTDRPLSLDSKEESYLIERIARLDDISTIAATASKSQLQNPDFLLIGSCSGGCVVQPADAKFSVETAKSKQVSGEVAAGLIALGPVITDHIPGLTDAINVVDGFFLCPDFSLTHYMMQRRNGSRASVSVPEDQVTLLPITSESFMEPMSGRDLALWLAAKDGFPISPHGSLMLYLYYFRLARACVGCWIDQTAPLLAFRDKPEIDLDAILAFALGLEHQVGSAWELVLEWDSVAELVRRQRVAVDHAASLPIASAELKIRIEMVSKRAGIDAPSTSKVRRTVGSWFRSRLREEYGEILPPVENLPRLLRDLNTFSRSLRSELLIEIEAAVIRIGEIADPAPIPVVATH